MPINKATQLVATIVEHPYLDKECPTVLPVPLVIDSAIYYNPANQAQSLDVEPYISGLIIDNRVSFIVENETFGGNRNDPAPRIVKMLRLTYSYNGITTTMTCKEKSTVILQCN